uniref:Uncharacterized protein n=1 Tax=Clytia hemisphaerica TaxID=252671 RepID=A0A7M5V0H3_9CNID
MFIYILLAIPSLFLLWVLITYVEHLINSRKYPKGPFPLPLIGNLNLLSKDLHLNFLEIGKTYGDVFSISIGMKRYVIVNSYENVKEGLITKGHEMAGRSPRLSLLVATKGRRTFGAMDYSKSWAFIRKLAYKSLHLYGSGMTNIEDIVTDDVDKLCSIISDELDKPVPIQPYLGNTLINTICRRCFSTNYEIDDPEFRHILEFTANIGKGALGLDMWLAMLPWLVYLPHFTSTAQFKMLVTAVNQRSVMTHRMFEEHKTTLNPDKLRDVTDQLLFLSSNKEAWKDAGFEEVSQDHLENTVNILFFAGIETSLTTLRWFFLYCLHHPEYQKKMHDEIVDTFGLRHRLTYSDLDSLPFTQAMLFETNRKSSIARINVAHKAMVDTSINGINIPKGAPILFNLYSLHYDENHWVKPHEFNPHRWLNADGNLKKERATHYLPFSAGTRVCLGEKMAKVQMFLITTKLIRTFEICPYLEEKLPGLDERGPGGPYSPATDYKVIFKRRIQS